MQKMKLRTRKSYEPNRLAETYLLEAYEKLIPIVENKLQKNEEKGKIKLQGEI